jgi:hypothetical protein
LILEVNVNGQTLNLLKDYGRIPMDALKQLCQNRKDNPPTTLAKASASIDSSMMFECIEKSLEPRVATKLLKPATSIDRDGPVMLKQIIENTFITTTPTTFATKTELFSLDLKDSRHNIVTFHEDVREKVVSLEAVGHATANIDLVVSLFMAYETSDNDLFKLEVRLLKSAYDRGTLSSSDELMEATEARYDELVKTGKWKPTTPKDDPNLIALTATIKSLQDSLQANKGGAKANGGNSSAVNHAGPKALGNMTRLSELTANTLVRLRERTPMPTNGAQAPAMVANRCGFAGTNPASATRTTIATLVVAPAKEEAQLLAPVPATLPIPTTLSKPFALSSKTPTSVTAPVLRSRLALPSYRGDSSARGCLC